MFIKLTKYAERKMIERGISMAEIEKAIKSGNKYIQKPNKIIAEHGYFAVVYKKVGNVHYVITVKPRW